MTCGAYTQCHFFAGIAGWSFALQLAGWPSDRQVWTGSCPCQPFSSAGRQQGKGDDRHLWPVWQRLIGECRPATVFGEQVASAIAHGWLDDVYQGLEAQGYAVGSAVLPACGVGAPHKRDRLWFVAHAAGERSGGTGRPSGETIGRSTTGDGVQFSGTGDKCHDVANTSKTDCEQSLQAWSGRNGSSESGSLWNAGNRIDCPDGKSRLIEPGIPLLVDGFQHRRAILHALGNAIVPQAAAELIKSSI